MHTMSVKNYMHFRQSRHSGFIWHYWYSPFSWKYRGKKSFNWNTRKKTLIDLHIFREHRRQTFLTVVIAYRIAQAYNELSRAGPNTFFLSFEALVVINTKYSKLWREGAEHILL